MKDKYVKLIVVLQERKGFVKGGELAQKLRVSDRTIRSYIKDLNDNYLIDAKIKNNKNKGYILTGEIKEMKRTQQIEFEERAFFIVKYLMEKEAWATYEEIAEGLLFSSQTIRNDVLKIQQLMDDQLRDIKVETIIFQGIRLVGSEIDKRLFLDSLSNPPALTSMNFIKLLSHYFKDWISAEELDVLAADVEQQVNLLRIPTNNESMLPIISYMIICLKRVKNNHLIPEAEHMIVEYDIKKTKEYGISKRLMQSMFKRKNISIPESEIIYFSFYLMSQRLLFEASEESETYIPEEIRKTVQDVLIQLEQEYAMDFSDDSQLSSGLILHLARDLYPLTFNFYIENSFITTIKQEYIQAYYIAVSFTHMSSKKLRIKIPENEIGFLALHFASFIERKNKEAIQAVIVSGRNLPSAHLLKKNLEREIPGLMIKRIIGYEEINSLAPSISLIISPYAFSENTAVPAVCVNELATAEDIMKLKNQVNRLLSNRLLKVNCFMRTDSADKSAVLENLLQKMNLGYLFDSVLERERLSTTEVGNGAAIPHPLAPSHDSQMKIGVAVAEKPIDWGSEEVAIVFLIVPGKDKQAEMSELMEELHRIVVNKEILKKILKAKNKSEAASALEI